MSVEPGAPAIIPGKAEMILQFRDADKAVLDRFEAALLEIVAAPKARALHDRVRQPLAHHADGDGRPLLDAIEEAAVTHAPDLHMRMPSGAGHDAQILGSSCRRRWPRPGARSESRRSAAS